VLAFLTGVAINVFLHESSHSVAGALMGYRPTQVPFAVEYRPDPTTADQALGAITGPIFSVVSGLIGVLVDRLVRPFRHHPYLRLVWLWTVFCSLQEGVGYFCITAIIPAGDTGSAFNAWNLPVWAFMIATAAGIGGQFLAAYLFSEPMAKLTSTMQERRTIAFHTWIFGTIGAIVLTVIYLLLTPGIDIGSIIGVVAGTIACGVFAPMSMMFRTRRTEAERPFEIPRLPLGGVIAMILIIAFNLFLTRGLLY